MPSSEGRFGDQYTDEERTELFWDALKVVNEHVYWSDASMTALLDICPAEKKLHVFQKKKVLGAAVDGLQAGVRYVDAHDRMMSAIKARDLPADLHGEDEHEVEIKMEPVKVENKYEWFTLYVKVGGILEFRNADVLCNYIRFHAEAQRFDVEGGKDIEVLFPFDIGGHGQWPLARVESLVVNHKGSSNLHCPANLRLLRVGPLEEYRSLTPSMTLDLRSFSRSLQQCTLCNVILASGLDMSAAVSLEHLKLAWVEFFLSDERIDFSMLGRLSKFEMRGKSSSQTIVLPGQVAYIDVDFEKYPAYLDLSRVS